MKNIRVAIGPMKVSLTVKYKFVLAGIYIPVSLIHKKHLRSKRYPLYAVSGQHCVPIVISSVKFDY